MKITVCRMGELFKANKKRKGAFVREFDSIESLAKFSYDNRCIFCLPNLDSELSRKELRIFSSKYRALHRR